MKVLFVDDYTEMASQMAELMSRNFGYKTNCASSADEGLGLIKTFNPDVIFSDVAMPRMDGVQFCREARKRTKAPFFFLTSYPQKQETLDECGADGQVLKPCKLQELDEKIKKYGPFRETKDIHSSN